MSKIRTKEALQYFRSALGSAELAVMFAQSATRSTVKDGVLSPAEAFYGCACVVWNLVAWLFVADLWPEVLAITCLALADEVEKEEAPAGVADRLRQAADVLWPDRKGKDG